MGWRFDGCSLQVNGDVSIGPVRHRLIRRENPTLDLGVMMLPTPKGGEPAAALGGWSFIVPKDAKQPGLARASSVPHRVGEHGCSPAVSGAEVGVALPRFADPILELQRMLPYAPPAARRAAADRAGVLDHVQRVLVGDVPTERAMNEAAIEIDRLLASLE
jgi:multiple sugar transport system substrate-binding protein